MSAVQATATGLLEAKPLPHLLVYVLDRRLTGTLVLEDPQGGKSAVWFESGTPVKAKTSEAVIYLGRLLVEMGAIDEATYTRTLGRVAREKLLFGEILLAEQAIDRDTLILALREQLERKVEWMFTLPPECVYGFYEKQNFLERWGGRETPRIAPLALLCRGLRTRTIAEEVRATLARLPDGPLRLNMDARVGLFKFDQHEQAVTDVLRAKPQTLSQLLSGGVGDESLVRRVLYLLTITRHLDLGVADQKPVGLDLASTARSRATMSRMRAVAPRQTGPGGVADSTAPSPSPPSASSRRPGARQAAGGAAVDRRIEEMKQQAEEIAGQNYYQILGVENDATKAAIQSAFFQLAKSWHPDRLTDESEEIREIASKTFSRMSEAHQVLCDKERRREYDALLKEGGGTAAEQEQVARVLRAVTQFQKAEVLLKKGSYDQAEVEARAAAEGDPEQPEYVALHVWLLAQKPERTQSGQYDDLIKMLTGVIKKHEENERARFYRAQLLKRSGRVDLAMRDFRWIAEKNPKNLDAAREVRLYRMRKGDERSSGGASDSAGGDRESLLGKLFKR